MIWAIVGAVVVLALMLWGPFRTRRPAERRQPPVAKKQEPAPRAAPQARKEEEKIAAVVAIVIDDLGQDLQPARDVLALPDQVTLAIMPGLPQSRRIAELARQQGREVIVHIPMEAKERVDKHVAPGLLRADMTPMKFLATVNEDIDSVPGAAGVNNHEGSALTENREAMNFLMSALKPRGLYFLDSYTTPGSAAFATAKDFGLKAARRDVFLDNESDNPAAIEKQLDELARLAREHGRAIGIGHPHPATIAALRKWLPVAAGQGIEFLPLSRLVQ